MRTDRTERRARKGSATAHDRSRSTPRAPSPRLLDLPRTVFLVASFLSGAAALNYELLWMRDLSLLAGSTQAAISTVLSVYFLGLAIGSFVAGRFVRRLARPLLFYVGVEILIGLWALLFRPLLGGMGGFYGSLYATLPVGSPVIFLLRLTSAAGLLLIPATCMGATLPLLVHSGARDLPEGSRWSGLLYGVKTLGAMTGTFLTGFILIERLGVGAPLHLTAVLNLACAAAVFPWARRRIFDARADAIEGSAATPAPARTPALEPGPAPRLEWTVLLSFGVLGFSNIAVEVLWTRFYALIYPNDTYVFTTLLLMSCLASAPVP